MEIVADMQPETDFLLGPEAGIMQNIKCVKCGCVQNLNRADSMLERI